MGGEHRLDTVRRDEGLQCACVRGDVGGFGEFRGGMAGCGDFAGESVRGRQRGYERFQHFRQPLVGLLPGRVAFEIVLLNGGVESAVYASLGMRYGQTRGTPVERSVIIILLDKGDRCMVGMFLTVALTVP